MAATIQSSAAQPQLSAMNELALADRLILLRGLIALCAADGSLDRPLRVTDAQGTLVGYVSAMYPRTKTQLPPLTDEKCRELARQRANRQGLLTEEEFLNEIHSRIKERAENAMERAVR